jgi:PTH1 family peptidyl-tRNA hydrolase
MGNYSLRTHLSKKEKERSVHHVLVVGLGNPGPSYTFTRHNIGFMILDVMADRLGFSFQEKKNAHIAQVKSTKVSLYYLKPQTYMNLSAQAVIPMMQWLKLKPHSMIVVHDDIDLGFGIIRHKLGGGSGGHNGLKSIDQSVGNGYWRLRLGVGRPALSSMVSSYVLAPFNEDEMKTLPDFLCHGADQLIEIVEKIMSLY